MVFEDVVTYSGWIASLFGTAYIGYQHRESRRQRAQADQLAELLARADQPVVIGGDRAAAVANTPVASGVSEQLRAALIRAAAAGRPVRTVCRRVRELECDERAVLQAVKELDRRGVLRAEAPLSLDSRLELRV